jgi:transcriptional regulator with XRE-family HTH domain
MLGQRLQAALKSAGISTADAAAYIGISEANLYKLFKKDSFEVAYLRKAAELLKTSVASLLAEIPQISDSQIGGLTPASGNASQPVAARKVKVDKGQPQQDLAAALAACQRELEVTRALVAAKDETISLLRATYTRPS